MVPSAADIKCDIVICQFLLASVNGHHEMSKKASRAWSEAFVTDRIGAGEMNRTPDLLITNELLYRLSYTGTLGNDCNCAGKGEE